MNENNRGKTFEELRRDREKYGYSEELLEALNKVKEEKVWTYEYDGDTYTVNFEEFLAADGETVEKWTIDFEILYGDYVENPEEPVVPEQSEE